MQKKINIILYSSFVILVFFLIGLFLYDKKRLKEYSKIFHYFNTDIIVKIYTSEKGENRLEEIDKIYKKYSEAIDSYHSQKNLSIYDTDYQEYITIPEYLYNLFEYGMEEYKNTNGIIDISKGNVLDSLKNNYNLKKELPSEELNAINNQKINDIILIENNKIKNNHVNINVDLIIKAYMNEMVKKYLEENKINQYYIYTKDTILLGDSFKKDYKIFLPNINETLNLKNKAVITISNEQYYNQMNLTNLTYSNYMKSVTVIAEDSRVANRVANMLFHMEVEDGKKYIETLNNVEVIWYQNDNQIIKTSGIYNFTENT